jgi:hypothetical protein
MGASGFHYRKFSCERGPVPLSSGIQSAFQFHMEMPQPLFLFAPELSFEGLAAHAFLH